MLSEKDLDVPVVCSNPLILISLSLSLFVYLSLSLSLSLSRDLSERYGSRFSYQQGARAKRPLERDPWRIGIWRRTARR
jgi:hypothetical protein